MSRKKIRKRDTQDNIIDSAKIIDGTILADDIKPDGITGINGETLYYDAANTITIKDKIDNLTLESNYTSDKFTTNPSITQYTLSNSLDLNKPFFLWYNGQKLIYGASYDFEIITVTQTNDTIELKWNPETNRELEIFYNILP